jgi:hypothetical protein
MTRRIKWFQAASVAATILAAAMSLACGGGGGAPVNPPGLTAAFTPAAPQPPPAMSVSMASGGGSAATFRIDVMVTDIDDFSGAAFPVRFGTGSASFVGHDATGSVIEEAGVALDIEAQPSQSDPGVILVVASRQGAGVAGVPVVGSRKLITLIFQADAATGGNSFTFDATAGQRVVTTCALGQACVDVAASWQGGTMTAN